MKLRLKIAFLLVISMFMVGNAHAGWRNWSQAEKNQAIVDETYDDINDYVGVSCKVWVQNIVRDASNGASTVPQTVDPPGYYWNYNQYAVGRFGYIEDAEPGEIVQMALSSGGPHTAIVLAISSNGVTFIESNWCDPPCYTVRIRYVSFTDFYNQVDDFSIYYMR